MMVRLESAEVRRGRFSLAAGGTFLPGIHRVGGVVGSGKSTLALLMAGLLEPSAGRVARDGIGRMILSLQFPEYHVTEATLAAECTSWGVDPDPVLTSEGFGDDPRRDPLTLSRGELKRLHLACVLAKPCDLLLLDEPFAALDCRQKEIFCSRLSAKKSGIVILFTHEEEFLPGIDHSWEIAGGRLYDCGAGYPGRQPDQYDRHGRIIP